MASGAVVVERYRVTPAVDVERLRAALRSVAALLGGAGDASGLVLLAFGPSLLGTLAMDALPVGARPFVDPDGVVRRLRDDVIVVRRDPDTSSTEVADLLSGLAGCVEQASGTIDSTRSHGVLALCRTAAVDRKVAGGEVRGEVRGRVAPAPDDADAALVELLGDLRSHGSSDSVLGVSTDSEVETAVAADFYVVLDAAALDRVLSPPPGERDP